MLRINRLSFARNERIHRKMDRRQCNAEQLDFIDRPLTSGTLLGIPGGGKTRAIIWRVLSLVENGLIPKTNGFLILTFSRLACRDFLDKGVSMTPLKIFSCDNVRTLHSLAGHIRRRMREPLTSSIQTIVARCLRSVKSKTTEELRQIDLLRNVRVIFVDEAQDISEIQYDFVCALGEKLGPVVMVGDPNQSIYAFQGGNSRFLRCHPGWQVTLRTNYRSTRQIVDVINAARPVALSTPMVSISGDGSKPLIYVCNEDNGRLKSKLIELVREDLGDNGLKSCAIVGPVRLSLNGQGQFNKIGLQWAANVLSSEGISFEIHYNEGEKDGGNDRNNYRQSAFEPGRVHLLTIHGSKGLEFDTVILLNFHHNTMGFPPTPEDLANFDCLWYVGLSRARLRLNILCLDDQMTWKLVEERRNLFDIVGSVKQGRRNCAAPSDKAQYNWRDLLNDRKLVGEMTLVSLENDLLKDDQKATEIECEDELLPELPDWATLSMLYGELAENYLEYTYVRRRTSFFDKIKHMTRPVIVHGLFAVTVGGIRKKFSLSRTHPFSKSLLSRIHASTPVASSHPRGITKRSVQSLIEYVCHRLPFGIGDEELFHIHTKTETQFFDVAVLEPMVKDWARRIGAWTVRDVWKMTLFLWQYDHEAKYRWINDDPHEDVVCEAFEPYAKRIDDWAMELPEGCEFHVPCHWIPHLPIAGEIDLMHRASRTIVELKFSQSSGGALQMIHGLQVAGYAHMLMADDEKPYLARVWNLYDGKKHDIGIDWTKREDVLLTLRHVLMSKSDLAKAD